MTLQMLQRRPAWMALMLCALASAFPGTARAQIVVPRVDPAAEPLRTDFEVVLAELSVAPELESTISEPPAVAAPAREEDMPAEDDVLSVLGRVHAGLGVGTRDLEWPTQGETLAVQTGAFIAVELGATVAIALSNAVALGPEFAYQTSLDHEVKEEHISGQAQTIAIRAHRFEGLLAVTFRFGERGGFRITPALGYGVRNLRPEVHHLLIPSYSLAGPLARVTLRIPLAESVALRLGPELQYVLVGDELEEHGVESNGLAFGGDAALELALSASVAVELTFREAHALMRSALGTDSADVERFTTVRLVWQP
jgi:hypothetical protein